MTPQILSDAIGRIYDCAIDTDSWTSALELVRDQFGAPFAAVHLITCTPDTPGQRSLPQVDAIHTDWEPDWVRALPLFMEGIPRIHALQTAEMDEPVVHSELIGAELYFESRFHANWLAPQGLADGCTTTVLRRELQTAMVSIPVPKGGNLPDQAARDFIRLLAPHVRRALLISDMLNVHRQRVRLMAGMLDALTVPVFLVGQGARLDYANAAAEAVLATGLCLNGTGGTLKAATPEPAAPLAQAIERACSGQDAALGLWGNGVVLPNGQGLPAVAYVLPLGRSEIRQALGAGMAAVFLSLGAAPPPRVEVLTALSGLTIAEAHVALAVARGTGLAAIAAERGVSPLTVRKQLASVYDKTGLNSQAQLAAFVHRLGLPLRDPPEAGGQIPN